MKRGRVPYGLLQDSKHTAQVNLLSMESFDDTFGPKRKRKKPNVSFADYDAMMEKTEEKNGLLDLLIDYLFYITQKTKF